MTLTREDPRPLRSKVRAEAVRTVVLLAVSVTVYWAVSTYADDAVRLLRSFGLRQRQIEPWRLPVMALLIAIPVWHALSALLRLARLIRRYAAARRWERQLDDPLAAAEVPPLATHLIPGSRISVAAALGMVATSVLITLGAAGFVLGAAYGALPFHPSDDAIGSSWLLTVSGAWGVVRSVRAVGVARRAATVERMSSSGPSEVAVATGPQAEQVPELAVRFSGPLRPDPTAAPVGRILYLRLFDNLAGTERFVQRWRRFAVVHYLRSADQVTADEVRTWSGQVGDFSVFVDNDAELDDLLAQTRPVPGPDGFPAGELLCHGSYWKQAVRRLLTAVDLAVLDLTGYHAGHGGTAFEVQSAFDLVDVARLELTAAAASDRRFLAAQLRYAWSRMGASSPNAGTGSRTVVVHLG